jgi:hypothetical protein
MAEGWNVGEVEKSGNSMSRATGVFLALVVSACVPVEGSDTNVWHEDGTFHRLIARADLIVVRDGGFNCCGSVDGQKILLTLTNKQEILEFNKRLQFSPTPSGRFCLCCGYPGIDWYDGTNRLALTSIQHDWALRWKGFPCDAGFDRDTATWLVDWLVAHGINGRDDEFRKLKEVREWGPPFTDQDVLHMLDKRQAKDIPRQQVTFQQAGRDLVVTAGVTRWSQNFWSTETLAVRTNKQCILAFCFKYNGPARGVKRRESVVWTLPGTTTNAFRTIRVVELPEIVANIDIFPNAPTNASRAIRPGSGSNP